MSEHAYDSFMREAIRLARQAHYGAYPNPQVGAVLQDDDQIVARGWHRGSGLPHAEIECLNNAREQGVDPAGKTLVVTLEPCRHYGKTPPCVDAIISAGIKMVIYGAPDPTDKAGGGAEILKAHGIEVIGPVLREECEELIADFLVWEHCERPYVFLKLASTLDGRIATRNGKSRWISGEAARKEVHALRAAIGVAGGAILVGGGTFRADNPALTARNGHETQKQPLACILTSRLPKADADFTLLRERPDETIFFSSPAAAASTSAEALRKLGCRVFAVEPDPNGSLDYASMFRIMRFELGCPYALCEGGGHLALSLLENNFIDEFHLYYAPIILGDSDARPLFSGRAPLTLDEALKMNFCSSAVVGDDIRVILRPAQTSGGN